MEALTERAVYVEPCFRKSAKADGLGFNSSRDCASCLRTLEKDSAHVVLLFDEVRDRGAVMVNKWFPPVRLG